MSLVDRLDGLFITKVFADDGETIHSYSQFKNMMSDDTREFSKGIRKIISIGKNVGLVLLGTAFIVAVLSLIVQSGKLGGANIMGPEFNAKKKQEAYEGILHACLHFALIGAAAAIFSGIFSFFVGN